MADFLFRLFKIFFFFEELFTALLAFLCCENFMLHNTLIQIADFLQLLQQICIGTDYFGTNVHFLFQHLA